MVPNEKGLTAMMTIDHDLCIRCGSCVKACPMSILKQQEDGSVSAEQKGCLDCFHCAAACPVKAIGHHELGREALYPAPAEEGTLLSKFQRRRSIRHFKSEAPDRTLIQAALDGAAYAPSAKNQQVCQWTVVLGQEQVEALLQTALTWAKGDKDFRHLVWLCRHGMNPVTCGAPCLVIVHAPADSHNPQTDAAIAMALAEQLLVDSGLGTCWGGYLCRMIDRSDELKAALAQPEGHVVCGVLMAGFPDERYPNIPYRPAARIHWVE